MVARKSGCQGGVAKRSGCQGRWLLEGVVVRGGHLTFVDYERNSSRCNNKSNNNNNSNNNTNNSNNNSM